MTSIAHPSGRNTPTIQTYLIVSAVATTNQPTNQPSNQPAIQPTMQLIEGAPSLSVVCLLGQTTDKVLQTIRLFPFPRAATAESPPREAAAASRPDPEQQPAIRAVLLGIVSVPVLMLLAIDAEDGILQTHQIATKYGYRTEVHRVETHDGFVVEMHRLSASPMTGEYDSDKPPVFIMHGLLGSSADWILIGPQNALPYLLSDRGYDVWLGNARGNRYSRKHSYLSIETKDYWDFSWHEIGIYDVPVMIDHILHIRGVNRLHYIGHSQGTTAFLVMTSLKPEFNEKVIKLHALAPAAYLYYLNNPLMRYLATHLQTATAVVNILGVNQVMPAAPFFNHLANLFCPNNRDSCVHTMFLLSAAGASIKQFIHFGQMVQSGHFRQFDYGSSNNSQIYQSFEPPDYNLTYVRAPVAIYYGSNDQLTHPIDVRRLAQELPNLVILKQFPYNHMDFLLAADAKDVLYEHILASIETDSLFANTTI
ncbi:lipase 3-like [Malaya genurostris]|uniref:lipase 3-like n=1 Tax=Malaya genurostris TaxID=325434 RepID=UPI0026F3F1BF|nr:lipase 3-like [Malaya genurostris]